MQKREMAAAARAEDYDSLIRRQSTVADVFAEAAFHWMTVEGRYSVDVYSLQQIAPGRDPNADLNNILKEEQYWSKSERTTQPGANTTIKSAIEAQVDLIPNQLKLALSADAARCVVNTLRIAFSDKHGMYDGVSRESLMSELATRDALLGANQRACCGLALMPFARVLGAVDILERMNVFLASAALYAERMHAMRAEVDAQPETEDDPFKVADVVRVKFKPTWFEMTEVIRYIWAVCRPSITKRFAARVGSAGDDDDVELPYSLLPVDLSFLVNYNRVTITHTTFIDNLLTFPISGWNPKHRGVLIAWVRAKNIRRSGSLNNRILDAAIVDLSPSDPFAEAMALGANNDGDYKMRSNTELAQLLSANSPFTKPLEDTKAQSTKQIKAENERLARDLIRQLDQNFELKGELLDCENRHRAKKGGGGRGGNTDTKYNGPPAAAAAARTRTPTPAPAAAADAGRPGILARAARRTAAAAYSAGSSVASGASAAARYLLTPSSTTSTPPPPPPPVQPPAAVAVRAAPAPPSDASLAAPAPAAAAAVAASGAAVAVVAPASAAAADVRTFGQKWLANDSIAHKECLKSLTEGNGAGVKLVNSIRDAIAKDETYIPEFKNPGVKSPKKRTWQLAVFNFYQFGREQRPTTSDRSVLGIWAARKSEEISAFGSTLLADENEAGPTVYQLATLYAHMLIAAEQPSLPAGSEGSTFKSLDVAFAAAFVAILTPSNDDAEDSASASAKTDQVPPPTAAAAATAAAAPRPAGTATPAANTRSKVRRNG